jgi:hypothetical protein
MQRPASRTSILGLLLAVYVPTFLLSFGQGVIIPTLPLYAQSFGVSFSLVSLVWESK